MWIVKEKRRASVDEIGQLCGISGKVPPRTPMNAYRYEIEPRPAALGGGVRLYLYGPDQQTCEEIELGGGVFTSGPEEAEIKEGVCRGSVGRGFLARLAALLLKATLSAVNCFWSFARHAYFLVNIRYISGH